MNRLQSAAVVWVTESTLPAVPWGQYHLAGAGGSTDCRLLVADCRLRLEISNLLGQCLIRLLSGSAAQNLKSATGNPQ